MTTHMSTASAKSVRASKTSDASTAKSRQPTLIAKESRQSDSPRRNSRSQSISGGNINVSNEECSSLHSLHQLFLKYAKLRRHDREDTVEGRSSKRSGVQLEDDGEANKDDHKITYYGIETWFQKAQIFSTPLCKISPTDVKTILARTEKSALPFKEFENFIESLCQFKRVNPSTVVLRLQLAGSKAFQDRVFQTTALEGTVDRVVDAFRLDAEHFFEKFIDLTKDTYEEPICVGGVRGPPKRARSPNSKRDEEKMLFGLAKSMMQKGEETSAEDPLQQNFIYFAKNGNYFSDGRSIELTQLIKWMKQAGVIDGSNITSMDIGYLFKRLYSLNWCIFLDDLNQFLTELCLWKNADKNSIFQKMRSCGPPALSSVSTISMSLPVSMVELLKNMLNNFSEEFEEKRDQYDPTLADTPYGHTPNSRNRHFKNATEESSIKVRSTFMEDLKKGKGNDAVVIMSSSNPNKPLEKEENEVFSEEKRSGKDFLAKRWNDAYPIGGIETSHRGRLEADLEKLLFGVDRADDSSSDEEDKQRVKILKTKFVLTNAVPPQTINPAVPLEEQFDKFKRYGEHKHEDGITVQNTELWFTLAGLIVPHGSTVFTTKDVELQFYEFRYAKDNGCLDYETFLKFVDAIGDSKGKHTNAKEITERLCRCGVPRPVNTVAGVKNSDRASISQARKPTKTASKLMLDEDDPTVDPAFKVRFQEFSRFGEATVPGNTSTGISMLNIDKWFRQAKLVEQGFVPEDVDVLYIQLYPTKQRISMKEFLKLLAALGQSNKQKMAKEDLIQIFTDTGPPSISEIRSTTASRTNISKTKV